MSTEKQLKQVFDIVIDEIKTNEKFAKRIAEALGKGVKDVKNKKRGRQPAVFNPNVIAIKGESVLKRELEILEVAQLKDIISQYAMDPSKMTSKWKSKDKLMKYITDVVLTRLKKGDAFR